MSFDPVAALQRYHAAIDAQDVEAVAEMFAAGARYLSDGLGAVEGRDKIVAAMRDYFSSYPNHQSWDDEVIRTGDYSARSLWKLQATNKLSGEVVKRRGVEDVRFDRDGKIISVEVEDQS